MQQHTQRRRRGRGHATTTAILAAVAVVLALWTPQVDAFSLPCMPASRQPPPARAAAAAAHERAPPCHRVRRRTSRSDDDLISRGDSFWRSSSIAAAVAAAAAAAGMLPIAPAHARTEPLGVVNELLADCPRTDNCASSQDDRPPCFQEPWQYESSTEKAMQRLKAYVSALPGAEVVTAEDRYLRIQFTSPRGDWADDTEFFFTPNDAIVQFRSARRSPKGEPKKDGGENLRRMERIRIALGWEKIPVLRNRRRALFFMETEFDGFGPTYGNDAPIPEELGDVYYQDADPFSPTWEAPPSYPKRPRKQP